jgi:hypothetical protein
VDLDAYQSASGLKRAGAISGYDMTPEAALTKLIFLAGEGLAQETIEEQMMDDLRGAAHHICSRQGRCSVGRIARDPAVLSLAAGRRARQELSSAARP